MNASDIMTTDIGTCATGDSLNVAAQLMWDRRCGFVPILDRCSGTIAGTLTDRDIAMAAYTQGRRLDDIPVDTAMSRPAITCAATATVEEMEDLMMAHGVRRLVVVDGPGHVQGVVALDDLARCASEWNGNGDIELERIALTLGEIARQSAADGGPTPAQPETDLGELTRNALEALKVLRDEIRVDLNLAAKDARDRWRRLETRLRAAEAQVNASRGTAARNLAALVDSAKEFRRTLRKKASGREQRTAH